MRSPLPLRAWFVILVLPLLGAGVARAAGGPVPPQQGGAGASAPGADATYVALSAGPHRTLVAQITRAGGAVERSRVLHGDFGVPGIAYDGSTAGLSADGGTLVLAETIVRYPVRHTRLAVLNAPRLQVRARIALRGFFTVDALSPDGRWLYLVHYTSGNGTHYEVRAFDVPAHRLLPRPIVDPREPDEKMQGLPVTRVVSADGRWAYTLYGRGDAAPFVHALDTERRRAFCVDLPGDLAQTIFVDRLALTRGGRTLELRGPASTLASLDTRTFRVRVPPAPGAVAPARRAASSEDGGGPPWALLLPLSLAGIAALVVACARPLRRRATRSARQQ